MSPPPPPLDGFWQMLHAEFNGERAPELVTTKTTLELSAGRYAVRYDGVVHDEGAFSVEPSAGFSLLTLRGQSGTNAGRTLPSIYQRVGDRLRICYGLNNERPTAFASAAGTQLYLATYRRVTS